jgi:hypothetical protein
VSQSTGDRRVFSVVRLLVASILCRSVSLAMRLHGIQGSATEPVLSSQCNRAVPSSEGNRCSAF